MLKTALKPSDTHQISTRTILIPKNLRLAGFSIDNTTRFASCCLDVLNYSIDQLPLNLEHSPRSNLHLILLICHVPSIYRLFSSSETPLIRYDPAVVAMLSAIAEEVRHHQPPISPSEQISFFSPLLTNSILNTLFAPSSRAMDNNSPSFENLTKGFREQCPRRCYEKPETFGIEGMMKSGPLLKRVYSFKIQHAKTSGLCFAK
ncbi:hypothetical protein BLNAU_16425 [Blattamonas nauphoetae]|uniref:Uncharacterized protein n=1 Tax=Blattamonas nauphoetae TaxID=2049346 RepID=A0ABQ9XCU4_9EUKA|nr:hypothetical protein BLNAU_16425 [Blattamonas nauphoetae]